MSGTSADGVTAALCRFGAHSVQVLRCSTLEYPAALRARVLSASTAAAPELSRLNMELGELFAKAAALAAKGKRPAAIGSPGQTVWHGPDEKPRNTLQLAEPSVIAERTGIPVVADFRPRDIAAGGQGAPLMPAFDEFLFASGPPRAVQNIGGIANVTFVGNGKVSAGFDTGPGNCLMDLAVRQATDGKESFDRDGRIAARGRVDEARLAAMLRDPFFTKRPPKSAERTYFGEEFLRRHLGLFGSAELPDAMATLNALTAESIARVALTLPSPKGRGELIISGGGALNPVLMQNLVRRVGAMRVVTSQEYGIPPMAKEAACFAWMALRALRGQPNNCPSATGAKGRRVLGKVIPA